MDHDNTAASTDVDWILSRFVWGNWLPYYRHHVDLGLSLPGDGNEDDSSQDGEDDWEDSGSDNSVHNVTLHENRDSSFKEIFLDSLTEVLAHTKGKSRYVSAVYLEEFEDRVVILVARNGGFELEAGAGRPGKDKTYFEALEAFMAKCKEFVGVLSEIPTKIQHGVLKWGRQA